METGSITKNLLRGSARLEVWAETTFGHGRILQESSPWYQSKLAIASILAAISFVLVLVLVCMCRGRSPPESETIQKYPNHKINNTKNISTIRAVDTEEQDNEETSLLGPTKPVKKATFQQQTKALNGSNFDGNNSTISNISTGSNALPKAIDISRVNDVPTRKFKPRDLDGGIKNDAELLVTFHAILAVGIVVNLHTTKGPRAIILSLSGDEVRWQAVKSAKKRYKLHLRDVVYVEIGKGTSNFMRNRTADDSLCFSLVTQKTTLDLEVSNKLDRDCFVRGFELKINDLKSPMKREEAGRGAELL